MRIVYVASECAPFVKTGGLGDVAGALTEALAESKYKGNEITVFLPYYSKIKNDSSVKTEFVAEFEVQLSWRKSYVGLFRYKSKRKKLQIYFIDNDYYFGRERLYGYYDDGERFAFFCKAVLEALCFLERKPDIIHCNDWQTALIPALLHAFYNRELGGAKTVFTIHNIEYQGKADPLFLADVLGIGLGLCENGSFYDTFLYDGSVNFLKGAILGCDALTTVSESYAKEIRDPYFAHGLSKIISEHAFKTRGIVNGIDLEANDPNTDRNIAKNYGIASFEDGKAVCKQSLQEHLGLPVRDDVMLIGMVSRIVEHKGFDILCDAIEEMMMRDIQLVILGTGDEYYEDRLKWAAGKYPEKIALELKFSTELASMVYSASDAYLMPSKSEPCGLSQMIAMRYGSLPIVHETGGLKDTVPPFERESLKGYGFTFKSFDKNDMLDAVWRAYEIYVSEKEIWKQIINNCMSADLSWKSSAQKYMDLYEKLISNDN